MGIPKATLLASRDSVHDCGRAAPSGPLQSIDQLLIVNFQRVKESLRVLEECRWIIAGRGNAAERLGMNRSTLRYRMKKLGIERPGKA